MKSRKQRRNRSDTPARDAVGAGQRAASALRSLAYHRVVAERLRADPRVLETARAHVRKWIERGVALHYAKQWERLLAGPVESLCEVLVSDSEDARALRQTSPFAGVVDPRERWRIWARVRDGALARP